MKNIRIYILLLTGLLGAVTSCKDDSLEVVPTWESAVHGNAAIVEGSSEDFVRGAPAEDITVDLQWISIDNKTQVTKIDIYVVFNESYTDVDGNTKTAKHGGDEGRLYQSFEGGEVPANRGTVTFTVDQPTLYALYQDATFDYGDGSVSVFSNPDKPSRDAANRFIPGDAFKIRWEFTTSDGRVFKAWGVSVCTEFPDANCSIDFSVVCASEITNPGANGGVYEISLTDTYGDGWNGAALRVIIDGVATDYTLDDGSSGTELVTVPPTATTLTFEYISGDWDSEVIFTIKSPKGNIIANYGPSPPIGPVKLNLCDE
jgi:hypothetical protein